MDHRSIDIDTGVGKCPILGLLDTTLTVAIIDHIPNGI